MSDLMMFLIVGGALGVLALLSVAMWILILHKSHTEWRLAADNYRFTSSAWSETSADTPSQSAR
ncbi:flagellar motor protein MotA [Paraburkholderia terrae]